VNSPPTPVPRCIGLLAVFCRPVRAPGLQRMAIVDVGRVPPRGACSIPTDNLQMHQPFLTLSTVWRHERTRFNSRQQANRAILARGGAHFGVFSFAAVTTA